MKKQKNKPVAVKLIRGQGEQMQRESAEKWLERQGVRMEK